MLVVLAYDSCLAGINLTRSLVTVHLQAVVRYRLLSASINIQLTATLIWLCLCHDNYPFLASCIYIMNQIILYCVLLL